MSSRIVALGMILLAASAWPHHNMSATFDLNNRVTFTGTLTKLDWRNPHIEFFVDAKGEKDQTETWSVEGPPPVFFRDRDINRTDVESALGKTVTVEASRAKDGSRWGLMRTLTLPGGKLISACPQNC